MISAEPFVDGRVTSTLLGKRNLQLPVESPAAQAAGAVVLRRLHGHEVFQHAVHPSFLHPPLFSRYEPGMEYPDHVDNAVMGGHRNDVSVTVFLSGTDTYEGGELVVDTGNGYRSYRLPAGDAVAYPSSTLHHVAPVTRGVRLAAV